MSGTFDMSNLRDFLPKAWDIELLERAIFCGKRYPILHVLGELSQVTRVWGFLLQYMLWAVYGQLH